jgi:hypothetical protein
MPLVKMLIRDDVKIEDPVKFGAFVREVIASSLSCDDPDGHLDPEEDIELVCFWLDRSKGDHSPCGISISVEAKDLPVRVGSQKDRAVHIRDKVKIRIPTTNVGVWLDLKPAVWTEA